MSPPEHSQHALCVHIPCALVSMNDDLMSQYIEFVTDRLLMALGYKKLYN